MSAFVALLLCGWLRQRRVREWYAHDLLLCRRDNICCHRCVLLRTWVARHCMRRRSVRHASADAANHKRAVTCAGVAVCALACVRVSHFAHVDARANYRAVSDADACSVAIADCTCALSVRWYASLNAIAHQPVPPTPYPTPLPTPYPTPDRSAPCDAFDACEICVNNALHSSRTCRFCGCV
jgi:hypothetical protein